MERYPPTIKRAVEIKNVSFYAEVAPTKSGLVAYIC